MARNTRGCCSIMTSSTEVMPASAREANDDLRPGQAHLLEGVATTGASMSIWS